MAKLILAASLAIVSLSLSGAALGQQGVADQIEVTARSCNVQVNEFKSKCDTRVRLLDNKTISVLFVTVKSVPEEHEISFYTEHVGMLVFGADGGMMGAPGRCRNDTKSLHCSTNNRAATLEILW
jgi:hypothetical protein